MIKNSKNPWKIQRNKIKYVSCFEIEKLFKAIKNTGHSALTIHSKLLYKRDLALFNLIYFLGLRASEVRLLNIDDYNPYKKEIYVRALKNGVSCVLRIDNKRAEYLNNYLKERKKIDPTDNYDPLFHCRNKMSISIKRGGISHLLQKYTRIAGWPPEKRHPHVLRHSIAVHLLDSGLYIQEVQAHLRHTDLRSTLKYSAYTAIQGANAARKIEMSNCIA